MIVRGRGQALEFAFGDQALAAALPELRAKLDERAGFYRGCEAVASFDGAVPPADEVALLLAALRERGIALAGVHGGPAFAAFAEAHEVEYLGPAPPVHTRRAKKVRAVAELSESARSLVADFAGARADLAVRRDQIAAARVKIGAPAARASVVPLAVAPALPQTLYHKGTLRGGQSLHHAGTIVVVGDVNPGAEVVASGDIIVLGALRGIAHAGAQGEATAFVIALDLAAPQLRIANRIAVTPDGEPLGRDGAQRAAIDGDHIIIAPFPGATT